VVPDPVVPFVAAAESHPIESRHPRSAQPVPAAAPAPAAHADVAAPAAPIAEPSAILPETGLEKGTSGGLDGGVAGGVPGGVVGGLLGVPASAAVAGPPVVRVGNEMKPPRRIKDVRPIYPESALASRGRASVFIEATIGPDGRVQNVKLLHSAPPFDQAALDAVRQWEYEPSLLNGVPVAVVMTVIVNFALQ
jgi:protein TonB